MRSLVRNRIRTALSRSLTSLLLAILQGETPQVYNCYTNESFPNEDVRLRETLDLLESMYAVERLACRRAERQTEEARYEYEERHDNFVKYGKTLQKVKVFHTMLAKSKEPDFERRVEEHVLLAWMDEFSRFSASANLTRWTSIKDSGPKASKEEIKHYDHTSAYEAYESITLMLASLWSERGDWASAVDLTREILVRSPTSIEAWISRGYFFARMNVHSLARVHFTQPVIPKQLQTELTNVLSSSSAVELATLPAAQLERFGDLLAEEDCFNSAGKYFNHMLLNDSCVTDNISLARLAMKSARCMNKRKEEPLAVVALCDEALRASQGQTELETRAHLYLERARAFDRMSLYESCLEDAKLSMGLVNTLAARGLVNRAASYVSGERVELPLYDFATCRLKVEHVDALPDSSVPEEHTRIFNGFMMFGRPRLEEIRVQSCDDHDVLLQFCEVSQDPTRFRVRMELRSDSLLRCSLDDLVPHCNECILMHWDDLKNCLRALGCLESSQGEPGRDEADVVVGNLTHRARLESRVNRVEWRQDDNELWSAEYASSVYFSPRELIIQKSA